MACVELSPIQSCRRFESVFKIPQQTSHDIPAVGASNLDVALLVDADNRMFFDSRRMKISDVQFSIVNEIF